MAHLWGCTATLFSLGLFVTLIISFVSLSISRLRNDGAGNEVIWE